VKREIYINSDAGETRVAVVEDGRLVELNIERPEEEHVAGNVYKAKVENVLPGMQAAFVNIGLEKNAFLYVADAAPVVNPDEVEGDEPPKIRKGLAINKLLKPGQKIVVQVTKDPIGTKGARVSAYVTLPSHYVVLMPTVDYVGVSRRIGDAKERARLRQIATKAKPRGMGIIVRTAAEGRDQADIKNDIDYLHNIWKKIQTRAKGGTAPRVLHQDLGLVARIVRDVLTENVTKVVVDAPAEQQMVKELIDEASVGLKDRIEMHDRKRGDIFAVHGIEAELERALQRKVWLKSGGYLIIDQTEAFTVFDVNTGRYVGSTSLAQTVLDTNLEAAAEIALQLRLRDIGGIIVIDFIDMDANEHQQRVLDRLEEHLKRDRTRSNVLGFTQLGLVELTRKKVKQSLGDLMTRICPTCEGRGRVMSAETVSTRVRREIREALRNNEARAALVEVHPEVASLLIGTAGQKLRELEKELGKAVYVRGSEEQNYEGYKFRLFDTKADVQTTGAPVQIGDVIELRVEEQHVSNRKDGTARIEGFQIDIEDGGERVGERVKVEVTRVHRTFARARVIGPESPYRAAAAAVDLVQPIDELHEAKRREAATAKASRRQRQVAAQTTPQAAPQAAADLTTEETGQGTAAESGDTAAETAPAPTPSKRSRNRRRRPRKSAGAAQGANGQSGANGKPAEAAADGSGADAQAAAAPTQPEASEGIEPATPASGNENGLTADGTPKPKRKSRRRRPRRKKPVAETQVNGAGAEPASSSVGEDAPQGASVAVAITEAPVTAALAAPVEREQVNEVLTSEVSGESAQAEKTPKPRRPRRPRKPKAAPVEADAGPEDTPSVDSVS